jgi:transposase-like protein
MQPFVPVEALFKGRQFSGKIIMLCVSWYASFKLSLRDLLITMADRGIRLTHTTILRWVQRGIREALEPIRSSSRRILEDGRDLYKGWGTLGLPVSCCGQGRPHRTRPPNKITLDAYAASHRAVREMKEAGELPQTVRVRSSQYLNNLIEQDHRRVKQRIRPMLGFKRFDNAAVTISGIGLAEKIKKGQFKTGKLGDRKATMSERWNAALAA